MRHLLFLALAGLTALVGCGGGDKPAVARIVFTQQPVGTTAGTALASIQVTAEDATGKVVDQDGTVKLVLAEGPAGATLEPVEAQLDNGVATFEGLKLTKAGAGYAFDASMGTFTARSASFGINAGAPGKLAVTAEPAEEAVAGDAIAPAIQVSVRDAYDNAVASPGGEVNVALVGEGATLSGTLSARVTQGVATFADLSVDKVGAYTLRFGFGDKVTVQSRQVHIKPGARAALAFTVQPSAVVAGVNLAPAVAVSIVDKKGNVVPDATDTITLALADNPGGGTLNGTLTAAAVSGVATFGNLSLKKAAAGYTLQASSGSLTAVKSSAFAVTAAAPAKLAFGQQPGNGTAGEALNPAVTVTLLDVFDNVSPGTDAVTLALGSNPGNDSLSGTTTVAAVAGVATFPGLSLRKVASGYTLVASAGSLASGTSSGFDIAPAAAASLVFVSQPTDTTAGNKVAKVSVALEDAFGNRATTSTRSVSVELNAAGGASLLGTKTVDTVDGVASFSDLIIQKAGMGYTLRAFVTGSAALTEAASAAFDISAAAAAKLAFAQQPTDVVAGKALAPAVAVAVQDAFGNAVGSTASITLALKANPGGSTLSGTRTVSAVAGIATFGDLSLQKAEEGYALEATSGSLAAARSNDFAVKAAAPAKLIFSQQPANGTAGEALGTVAVKLVDAFDNVTTGTDEVTLAVGNNPGDDTLSGATTAAAVSGTASFTGLSLKKAGTGYTLTASSGSLTGSTSSSFNIVPAAPAALVFVSQPTDTTAGNKVAKVSVALEDAFGNKATNASTRSISVELKTATEGASLLGTLTADTVAGVASFSDLSLQKAGTGYTLRAYADSLTETVSSAFDVTAAAGAKLVIAQQPTDVVAGTAITPAVTVNVLDTFGNQSTSTANITVALASNPGSSTLSGTKTVAAVAGVATFGDLSLQKAAEGYTLKVSSGTLTTATSGTFAVTAAAPAKLAFAQQPTNGTAGEALSPSVTVTLLDMFDNVSPSTDEVTLALGSNPGGDTLSGTTTVAAVAGTATFSNVKLQKAATGYTLTASSGTLASDTSASFNVVPGAVASLSFDYPASSATAGGPMATVPVSLYDAFGNKATNSTKSITVEALTAPLFGTLTVNPVDGVATFSDLSMQKAGTNYKLRAYVTDAPTVEAFSTFFDIAAGVASRLGYSQQPVDAVAGKAFTPAVAVAVQDAYGNLVSSASASITVALKTNPGGSTFSGTKTAATVGGIATFTNLSLNKVGTGYSLNATATGYTAGVSANFNVVPNTPALLIFRQEPTSTTAGTTLAVTKVEAQDAFANIATNSTISINLALATNTAGAVLEGTTSVALVNGTATFDALTVKRVGKNLSLVATATGVTRGAVGTPFNISAGPAAKLAFTTQPGRGMTGVPLSPAPVVAVQDAYGNPTAYNGPVTVALGNNPTGGNLGGTTTVNATAGVASFSVNVDTAGTGYTLVAAGDSFSGVSSAPFDVALRMVSLAYVPPSGGKVSLQQNPASTDTRVILDLVAMEDLTGYGVGFNLPVDTTRAMLNPAGLTPGGILNPGSNPAAVMAVLPTSGPMAGVLSTAQSQKASGEGAVTTDTFIPAGSVLYSVQIDLAGSATPGVVFDGTTLPAGFNGALRDRQGNDVVGRNAFAIGRLQVQ